jgi:hypothetical protein
MSVTTTTSGTSAKPSKDGDRAFHRLLELKELYSQQKRQLGTTAVSSSHTSSTSASHVGPFVVVFSLSHVEQQFFLIAHLVAMLLYAHLCPSAIFYRYLF